MTSQHEDATWIVSLRAFPKLAEQIGCFIGSFAGLEMVLWCLYGKVIGTNEQGAMGLLGHIESFSVKITAIENFLRFSPLNQAQQERCKEFFALTRACNSFRNKIAHGLYASNDEGSKVVLVTHATGSGRKTQDLELTPEILESEIRKIDELKRNIINEFFVDKTSLFGANKPKHIV